MEDTSFLGLPAVKASNGVLELTLVPSFGCNIVSLRHIDSETEILRVPPSLEAYYESPFRYGIPILFPPSRIASGTFSYNGRTYHLRINDKQGHNHIHGFVHDKTWKVTDAYVDEDDVVMTTVFESGLHHDLLQQFPHQFAIESRVLLQGPKQVVPIR